MRVRLSQHALERMAERTSAGPDYALHLVGEMMDTAHLIGPGKKPGTIWLRHPQAILLVAANLIPPEIITVLLADAPLLLCPEGTYFYSSGRATRSELELLAARFSR